MRNIPTLGRDKCVQHIIRIARDQGFITHEEINALKELFVPSMKLESLRVVLFNTAYPMKFRGVYKKGYIVIPSSDLRTK